MKIKLITKSAQALENIVRFQKEVLSNKSRNTLVDTLSHFRAWYAIEEDGQWFFAPSKFIGYAGLTAELYEENLREMDGRATEVTLQPWFHEVSQSELEDQLQEELSDFCASFDKKPNALVRISVLREIDDKQARPTIGWVDAMLTLYRKMPNDAQQEFRRRLKND